MPPCPPRRVLFVLPVYGQAPTTGGERRHRHLVEGLRRRGFRVDVLTETELRLADLAAWRRLVLEAMLACGPGDVLVIDTWLFRWIWPLVWRVRLRSRARIVALGLANYWEVATTRRERLRLRLRLLLTALPAHRYAWVSRSSLASELRPFPIARKMRLMGTGLAVEPPASLPCRPPDAPLRLLSVGSFSPHKGFLILVEALALVARESPDLLARLHLTLVGSTQYSPDYAGRVREYIENHGLSASVTLLDEVPQQELATLYAGHDVFALASESEGFGAASVEAFCFGLPALLAPYASAHEVLGPRGDAGWVAPSRTPRAFADHLARLARSAPQDRARWRAAALLRGSELRRTWDEVAEKFLAALSD